MARRERQQPEFDPAYQAMDREVFGDGPEQVVRFISGTKRDPAASEREGHSVYVVAPYVQIRLAGERDNTTILATREHMLRFPNEWREYQQRAAAKTPLLALPTLDEAIARTLHELGITSVEDLVELPIAERVAVAVPVADAGDIDSEFAPDLPDIEPPRTIPAYLARFKNIARMYLQLRAFAEAGLKPRIRLESAA